jgi:diadenosine tetraphosphate (Ap4A) HIT family hydrolase
LSYPIFHVPGVRQEDAWQLFNCSNYPYYLLKVRTLSERICGFCTIDASVNKIYFETEHWIVMENAVAPRSDKTGQEHQFVIPSRRHVFSANELTPAEWADLSSVVGTIDKRFEVKGGVLVIRSGDPSRNARSMPHLHVNYHVPTGEKRIEITIAKSAEDLQKKLPILHAFENMRLLEAGGNTKPFEALEPHEKELVADKLGSTGSC